MSCNFRYFICCSIACVNWLYERSLPHRLSLQTYWNRSLFLPSPVTQICPSEVQFQPGHSETNCGSSAGTALADKASAELMATITSLCFIVRCFFNLDVWLFSIQFHNSISCELPKTVKWVHSSLYLMPNKRRHYLPVFFPSPSSPALHQWKVY